MALTIVFGYSGYLLPWDSLAYGAAVIGINLANSSPLIGKQIATLLFGGSALTPEQSQECISFTYSSYLS